jgi:hypothetical protein
MGTSPATAGNLCVDLVALPVQLGHAFSRVRLAALAHLLEQVEQRQQTRFGAHKLPLRKLHQPGNRLFGGRSEIELGLVGARFVKLAQPPLIGRRPIVE